MYLFKYKANKTSELPEQIYLLRNILQQKISIIIFFSSYIVTGYIKEPLNQGIYNLIFKIGKLYYLNGSLNSI